MVQFMCENFIHVLTAADLRLICEDLPGVAVAGNASIVAMCRAILDVYSPDKSKREDMMDKVNALAEKRSRAGKKRRRPRRQPLVAQARMKRRKRKKRTRTKKMARRKSLAPHKFLTF